MAQSDPALVLNLLDREAIRDLIQETAGLLDNENFDGWLELFAAQSEYEITAYSSEIKVSMSWWKSTREELGKMLDEIPQHVRDVGHRIHLVVPVSVSIASAKASARSQFAVLRTDREGYSNVYAAGRYEDELIKERDHWRYAVHRAVLDTRVLELGTHLPL